MLLSFLKNGLLFNRCITEKILRVYRGVFNECRKKLGHYFGFGFTTTPFYCFVLSNGAL